MYENIHTIIVCLILSISLNNMSRDAISLFINDIHLYNTIRNNIYICTQYNTIYPYNILI